MAVRAKEVSLGVYCLPVSIANVYFAGRPGEPWVLIDTAMPGHAAQIVRAAEHLYGVDARPTAILLTHGHMDHSGNAAALADLWDVPVYAHPLEMPFLHGQMYPPSDPTVGGFLALLGRFIQRKPVELGERVRTLEPGLKALGLSGWEWHHTPGHSPGHVSFYRRQDGTLIAGDAITTVNLDSVVEVALWKKHLCGPPSPFTCDWNLTRESVKLLADLRPITIAPGHGKPMSGGEAVMQLAELATDFPAPAHGRYVQEGAKTDETGVVWLPPEPLDTLPSVAISLGVVAAGGAMLAMAAHWRKRRRFKADTPIPAS